MPNNDSCLTTRTTNSAARQPRSLEHWTCDQWVWIPVKLLRASHSWHFTCLFYQAT